MTSHLKRDIARAQLRTAVFLFIVGNDRFSAITLAGAADVIPSQLILIAGKENFSDLLMKEDAENTGTIVTRAEHGRTVNDMLMINALKHMDPGDDDFVEMDLFVSALATVSKALANYVSLIGRDAEEDDFVKAFKLWARVNVPKGLDEDGKPIQ